MSIIYFGNMVSLGVSISLGGPVILAFPFLFRGFLSLELVGLPRFRRALDSFDTIFLICFIGTSVRARTLTTGRCDLVTLFVSTNASGN